VADRLSFRVFVGLSPEHDIPDHTMLCRFRTMLVARSLARGASKQCSQLAEGRS
jgi:IS5 family transposase